MKKKHIYATVAASIALMAVSAAPAATASADDWTASQLSGSRGAQIYASSNLGFNGQPAAFGFHPDDGRKIDCSRVSVTRSDPGGDPYSPEHIPVSIDCTPDRIVVSTSNFTIAPDGVFLILVKSTDGSNFTSGSGYAWSQERGSFKDLRITN